MTLTKTASPAALTVQIRRQAPHGWDDYLKSYGYDGFHLRSQWGRIFHAALRHEPYFLFVERQTQIVGVLPMMFISGSIFGRFLTSQPYLNTGGVLADSDDIARHLIDAAVSLADTLDVKHLELRHERPIEHAALNATNTDKLHMRLKLPGTSEELWNGLKSKVRSQIRKPLNDESLTAEFGRDDLLDSFYRIFCCNMRDLGTPPFAKKLFAEMLGEFGDAAEICSIRFHGKPVASGFLLHGPDVTFIPSASSMREFNHTSCNMLMYWHVLERAVQRGQTWFDFGRSSVDSGTHRFKKQWGAEEFPAAWQYYNRRGDAGDMRPDSGRFDRVIALWQKLPVWFTRLIGPPIVRGIP